MTDQAKRSEEFDPMWEFDVMDRQSNRERSMTDQTNKLEPCPFCGGEAESRQYDGEHFVQCLQCFNSTSADHQTEASAIAAWNRRASAPAAGSVPSDEEMLALAEDAARLDWFFGDTGKPAEFITTYLQGVREHWSLDQWREAIDAAMRASTGGE